ncbi:Pre-mRNA-splicing factor SYF1 [Debaryomyces fabryi]|uniref:Pre-mRNA-splicing factor SYF1 n=1 Tax=Debaryomyces fabryi TaxID=58627 RepID=A0A0V1PTQ0_9ASCO|nr:Pre-mRNA-splicing factor SYF1 [Debaryomyces fabryi]KRZ99635.1 Pre-mRNA-splicing factor SYF1 [Debaryomyces fabryi]CUM46449.1 unnamed protein product [Debaryomyces fabryi]
MSGSIWDIGELVKEEDIPYEQELAKNPNDLSNWLRYYRFKSSASSCTFRSRVFILERAVKQLPRSYKLWMLYIDIVLQEMQNSNSYKSKSEIVQVNVIFERSLQLLNRAPMLWIKYLDFLVEKQPYEITLLRRKFNECLYNLPISQHHLIWPLYIRFADDVGGMTGVKVYLKYLQYATPESLQGLNNEQEGELGITVDDIISKLIEFGDVKEASNLFQHILQHTDKFIGLSKSPLQLWVEYIDLLVNSVSKNKRGTVNYNELDYFFEKLIKDGLQKFPDQIGKFYLKLTFYFIKRKNLFKARYYFDEGLKTCVSVKDFTMIFDSYTEFEENILSNMSEKLERLGEDSDLNNELDMRMIAFEKLINDRPHLLNDMMLRQDVNNLDEWFKKIELFKEEKNINMMLDTYAAALRTINPLKAHSFSNNKENTLPNLWVNYANVYASQNDVKTANLIFSKSVKSQFQSPDDLATLYIEWSELFVKHNDDKKAIEIIENICTSELVKFDYSDPSIDIHIRVRKSIKIWSFYLDLLESMIENNNQTDEIEKVINAYNKTIELKIATPLTIINFANFLEDWNFYERSFSVYEIGLKIFKDTKIKFEIWNIYLSKIIKHDVNIERIRDLFEQCLNESSIEGYKGCPANLSKSVYLLYSQYEQSKGWITKSIKILQQGLSKLEDGYKQDSYTKTEKDTILQDKFDIYQILISKVLKLNDSNETRKIYEQSLKDTQLPLPSLIQLAREFINFETELMEFNRVRSLFKFVCQLSNPQSPLLEPVWNTWETFELSHGTESTFKDMLRYKRKIVTEFENDVILRNSLNPMGFVKSSEGPKVSSINMSESKEEINPDSIELDMDM